MKRIYLPLLFTLLFGTSASANNVFTYTPIKHATFVLQSGTTTIYRLWPATFLE